MSRMSADLGRSLSPILLRALSKLPLPLLRGLGSLAGRYSYWRHSRSAQVTRRNIERCFPDWSRQQQRMLEKASLRETGRLAGEILVVWSRSSDWLRRRIHQVRGLEAVKQQLAEGKGLIVLAPHLGNWEVLGYFLAELGPVTNLYDPPNRQEFETLVRDARQKTGASLVPANTKGVAALLRALKRGEISGILPDQSPNAAGGKFSEFFNQPAFTMTLIYKLVQRTGCAVVYGYAKRIDGGFEVVFLPAPPAIYSDDEDTALRALNQGVEECVWDVPEQYQWEYKRFKRQPDKMNFYADME